MSDKKIIVNISSDGKINAETFGFNGIGCVEELDRLLKDLATTNEVVKKDEFFKNKTEADNTVKVGR